MIKKEYTKPIMRLFNIHHHERLLIGSNDPTKKMQLYDDETEDEFGVM